MPSITITVNGIRKLLTKLNPYKAPGPNNLHPQVLKELSSSIAPALCRIFNPSLKYGVVSSDWKSANVTPLFKKGSKQMAENYRPISLTCICSKIMEHIMVSNIMQPFDQLQILSNLQHGFRKVHSCETQLIAFVDDLAKEIKNGGQSDVIVMDVSKAFDKVPHQELLYKLSNYGIDTATLTWLKSFLSNRKQRVVPEGAMSDQVLVSSGVPRLGPILFWAYINDLPQYVKSKVRLFADNTVMYLAIKSTDDCMQLMLKPSRIKPTKLLAFQSGI